MKSKIVAGSLLAATAAPMLGSTAQAAPAVANDNDVQIAATGDRDTTTVVELDMDSQTVTSFVRGADDTWSGGSSTPANPNPIAHAVEITAAQVGPVPRSDGRGAGVQG